MIGTTGVYCNNQGVVKNTNVPKSTLNKKHNSINYHVVCEAAAAGILCAVKEYAATNLAEPLTNLMPNLRMNKLLGHILYDY